MADRIIFRHDTSANWQRVNPVLMQGEEGIEDDTKLRKLGDGINAWNDLDYIATENVKDGLGNSQTVAISQKAVTNNVGFNDYEEFSDAKEYHIGDVVIKDGYLKEFIADHPIGSWIGTDTKDISLNEIQDKKLAELSLKTDEKLEELDKKFEKQTSVSKHDFSISDEKGANIAVFNNGHIRTKNFDSETTAYNQGGRHEFSISDEEGNNLVAFNRGHIRTKEFNSENTSYEDLSGYDFAISDKKGNNVVVFDKGHIKTKKFNSEELNNRLANIESLISKIVLSNSLELSITWNKGIYLKEDGSVETTILEGGQVSDFIAYTDGMAIIGGLVKQAQNYILACLYDNNKNKIGAIYATKDIQEDDVTNTECWQYLTASQDNLDKGHTLDEIAFIKVQSNEDYTPKVYGLTGFDRLVNNTYGFKNKKIAFFGGSYSSISTGTCFKGYLRFKLGAFVRTFGTGGAGFGINSCWYKGYPSEPELQDGKVVWEDSVPKQIDKAIQYCIDNDITDGFDYWILWASTNDFNTHIKGKGEVDYTLDQLQDTAQFSNADTQDGGIILSINKIRQAYPKAKILFFGSLPFFSEKYGYNLDDTTKPSANVWLENGNREQKTQTNAFKEFIDDQKAICEKYHIPYLDQMVLANVDEWNYENLYNHEDGYLHPLRQGFLRWINFQTNFILNN